MKCLKKGLTQSQWMMEFLLLYNILGACFLKMESRL
ncbi:Alternative oxidase mitochondrial [Bienertia sinuspersici]